MKKLIISSVLGLAFAASTAFGQGYITFGGSTIRDVWDDASTTSGPLTDSGFDATFLWSSGTSTTSLPYASTPTNGTLPFSYSAAWLDISNSATAGGSWTVATTGGAAVIGQPSNATGTFQYDTLAAFGLDGTSPGEAINLYVVAWDTDGGLYNTLAAAEAGGAPLGWTSVFSYTLNAAPPGASSPETVLPEKFGIGVVPEPATLALAGLGGLSMLFLRRKKA